MTTLPDLLRARAADDPEAVALRVADTEVLALGTWEARSNAVARGLVSGVGVRPGDRVALVFGNDRWADYAIGYLAVLKAGAVALPLGSRFSASELEQILAHSGASVVVGDGGVEVRDLEATQPSGPFRVGVAGDDLAEIIYTSGTTGSARGVACSHANVMAHDLPPDAHAATGPVSFLHAFPIGTQAGQEALRVPLRIAGRAAVVLPSFDPEEMCRLVARHRVVRLQLVPAMALMTVASGAYRRHDVSSVWRVILSSAPAPPALFGRLAEAFPGASLWNAYALTEAGGARTLTEWDPRRPTAVGRPIGATEVRIVDDAGKVLGAGEPGEVWLRRSGTPTRTYYRDESATAETFVGGWVRTGDVGYVDAEGYLHLVDRKKDVIISGGTNVSSVEVENALYEHPAVVEAAVFGVPHPVLGEDVAAAVVVAAGSAVRDRELQDVVRARLGEHKVPHRVALVDRLPRNASGKVVKAQLREQLAAPLQPADDAAFVGPRDESEAVVASVWAAVLGLPRVGVHDDFLALGGHSLAAAQIAARVGDAFGVSVPVTAVFEAPTVAELALAVRDERPRSRAAVPTS